MKQRHVDMIKDMNLSPEREAEIIAKVPTLAAQIKNPILAHFYPGPDNTLPPHLWEELPPSDNPIKKALEMCKSFRPTLIYLSAGAARHPNKTPMIVQAYRLEWGN